MAVDIRRAHEWNKSRSTILFVPLSFLIASKPVKTVRPQCQPSQQTIYGASRNEISTVRCSVDAHPSDVTFRWFFNNTSEVIEVASSSISSFATHSSVDHRVQNDRDYGTLLCWARNAVGEQRDPCVFFIQSAGKTIEPTKIM